MLPSIACRTTTAGGTDTASLVRAICLAHCKVFVGSFVGGAKDIGRVSAIAGVLIGW